MATGDSPAPIVLWNKLSECDRNEYYRIRSAFHSAPKITSRERRVDVFPRDLRVVINFIERSNDNSDIRAILVGLCFVGPIVCINTQRLKDFTNRCKSAVNGSFQQLGYVAFRAKAKARECVIGSLPALRPHTEIVRQWTARAVSENAPYCFLSSFSAASLPEISADDLMIERPRKVPIEMPHTPVADFQFPVVAPDFAIPALAPLGYEWTRDGFDPLSIGDQNWEFPSTMEETGLGLTDPWFDDIPSMDSG